jgi:hypothetical protein
VYITITTSCPVGDRCESVVKSEFAMHAYKTARFKGLIDHLLPGATGNIKKTNNINGEVKRDSEWHRN